MDGQTKWVCGFDEIALAATGLGGGGENMRGLLGGKGADSGEMTRIGVPVPPGFIITTTACNAYLAAGKTLPEGLINQVDAALARVEHATGKCFGGPSKPLLVSCRPGAKFSMPAMMDTVLDIGLNDDVVAGLVDLTGNAHFVYDSYRRLVHMFATVVLGIRDEPFEHALEQHRAARGVDNDADLPVDELVAITWDFKTIVERYAGRPFPADPREQLRLAIEAVLRSWIGKRASDYRNAAGIAQYPGTAVNVQAMVLGNMGEDPATGVAMSRNATDGRPRMRVTPQQIKFFHPSVAPPGVDRAMDEERHLTSGLTLSPGAAGNGGVQRRPGGAMGEARQSRRHHGSCGNKTG